MKALCYLLMTLIKLIVLNLTKLGPWQCSEAVSSEILLRYHIFKEISMLYCIEEILKVPNSLVVCTGVQYHGC